MFTKVLKWSMAPVAITTSLYLYNRWRERPAPLVQPLNLVPAVGKIHRQTTFYRPNDWTHLYYATQAYQDSGGQVLKEQGWELIDKYSEANGYFGAAYLNQANKHIIIAHRGTQDIADWLSNADLITRRLNEQEVSAWDNFAKKIVEQQGPAYQYSFTGHSLGGWLAQTSLWKYQDEFVKDKSPAYPDAFAVTLDDPGARELLDTLQPRVDSGYKIDIDRLDITAYLSHPNIVNTALGHVGSTYALSPELDLSWLQRKTVSYTLKAHDKERLLGEFSDQGLPRHCVRVIDWPKVLWGAQLPSANQGKGIIGYLTQMLVAYVKGDIERGEYLGFYAYKTEEAANLEQLPSAARFQLKHGIHYNVRAFDEQVLPLRNMPSFARGFLEDLNGYSHRESMIRQLLLSEVDPQLLASLETYRINEYQELVLDKTELQYTARAFRDELLGFLKANPMLYQNKLAVLREEYTSKRLQTLEGGTLGGVLNDFREQSQYTQNLLYRLSFQQGTARLYQFIKPTWEEVEQLRTEQQALRSQLTVLQLLKVNLQKLDSQLQAEIRQILAQQEQQLEIAEGGVAALLSYMQGNPRLADKEINALIRTLQSSNALSFADQSNLLNRAYHLRAKIAASQGNQEQAIEDYQKAKELLSDAMTWSNFGGLLTDMGRAKQDVRFHIRAYQCYKEVYPRLGQLRPEQLPVVKSGMAYGLLLLAQNIERQPDAALPNAKALREQARNLLKDAIETKPNYLNARLFQAILSYDEGYYPEALQEINQVLALQPVHPTALMRKGFILEKLGQTEEALVFLGQAKEILGANGKGAENGAWIKEIQERILTIQLSRKAGVSPKF